MPENINEGYFLSPTIFANVTSDMIVAKEEIFGPVLSILGYENEEEAINIANDSNYGGMDFQVVQENHKQNQIKEDRVNQNLLLREYDGKDNFFSTKAFQFPLPSIDSLGP